MMKKQLLLVILFVLLLSGCVDRPFKASKPIEPNENSMVVNFKNNANFDLYGIEVGVINSTTGGVNADGSKIDKGEFLSFEFLEVDFSLVGETEMAVALITTNGGDVVPLNNPITIELEKNKGIFFELVGDSVEEAKLKRIENEQKRKRLEQPRQALEGQRVKSAL